MTTLAVVRPVILCVTESEKGEYAEYYPDIELSVHPDSVVGLAAKRQWIYEHFGDVFMVDDDIMTVRRVYLVTEKTKACYVESDDVYSLIQWAGNMARLCGCYLFGFTNDPHGFHYRFFQPIKLSGAIMGAAFGMLQGSKLRFPSEGVAVEDFYISGLNAYHHRKVFLDVRFCFEQAGTFKRRGGQSTVRSKMTEREDTLFLRRMFGNAIMRKTAKKGIKIGASGKQMSLYGRALHIPF